MRLCLLLCAASYATGASLSCMPPATLAARMPEWVGTVPYSHFVNKTWGYPTDCSGFVSWALQGKSLKAYEYGARNWSTRIPTADLRRGDIVTHVSAPAWAPNRCHGHTITNNDAGSVDHDAPPDEVTGIFDYLPGHVYFFDRWDDENKTHFWAYESTSTGTPAPHFNHHVLKKRKDVDKHKTDNCTSSVYGYVTGGAHRLSPTLLCGAATAAPSRLQV